MAEKDVITSLDLGIESTGVAGNLQAAEAFLAGDDSAIVTDPSEIEEIKEEEIELAGKKVTKKPVETPKPKAEPKEKEEEIDPLEQIKDDEEEEEEKEEGKEKKPEAKKDEQEEKKEEEVGFNEYEALAKDLFKIGVFTQTEGEEEIDKIKLDTQELLKGRFEKEGQIKATQWLDGLLSRFGDDRKELFEAVFIDGVDLEEYLPLHKEIVNLEKADITQEPVQEKVFREYYRRIGWEDEAIDKKLAKSKEYGDLADDAKELHPKLLAQDKDREQELKDGKAEQLALQQRIDQEYKVSIAKILDAKVKDRDFDGIPMNATKVAKAFDFLYTKKYKAADGQLLTEFDKYIIDTRKPENHALRVKMALLALDNFDLTKVEKRAVSKESSVIFNELAQKKTKKTGGSNATPTQKVSSWFQ